MLTITIPGKEFYDEESGEFKNLEGTTLILEHSLVSMSKWESKYCKPFLGKDDKTKEEVLEYIRFMVLDGSFSDETQLLLSSENLEEINQYISSEQSATTFYEPQTHKARKKSEIITSELVYYWMFSYNVPIECENWHLNRLFTLLRIFNSKNQQPKKMSKHEIATRNRDLNEQRKAALGTRG